MLKNFTEDLNELYKSKFGKEFPNPTMESVKDCMDIGLSLPAVELLFWMALKRGGSGEGFEIEMENVLRELDALPECKNFLAASPKDFYKNKTVICGVLGVEYGHLRHHLIDDTDWDGKIDCVRRSIRKVFSKLTNFENQTCDMVATLVRCVEVAGLLGANPRVNDFVSQIEVLTQKWLLLANIDGIEQHLTQEVDDSDAPPPVKRMYRLVLMLVYSNLLLDMPVEPLEELCLVDFPFEFSKK